LLNQIKITYFALRFKGPLKLRSKTNINVKNLSGYREEGDGWKQRFAFKEKDKEEILSESFCEKILPAGRRKVDFT
jgi:hypothetical protein